MPNRSSRLSATPAVCAFYGQLEKISLHKGFLGQRLRCSDYDKMLSTDGGKVNSWLTGYVRGADKYLAYLIGDGHVYELDCDGANGNRWTQADLCADFGFPPAASGSPLTGYVRGAEKYLAYLTGDGHVYELKCDGANGNRWTQADLCADFGFPAPARLQSAVLRTHTHGDDKDPDTGVYVEVHDNGKHHSLYRKR